MWNNRLYYSKRAHTNIELNQLLIWLNSLIYMIYKHLKITTYRFSQPTRPYVADLISNQSVDRLSQLTNQLLQHLLHEKKCSSSRRNMGGSQKFLSCLKQLFICFSFMGREVGWLVISIYILQQLLLVSQPTDVGNFVQFFSTFWMSMVNVLRLDRVKIFS